MKTNQQPAAHPAISHEARQVGKYYDHRIFDEMAKFGDGNLHYGYWHDDADQSTFEQAKAQLTAQMVKRLAPAAGLRVLDVGCGNGIPAIELARAHQVEVVGITVSANQVARASANARAADLSGRVRFEQADAMRLPYPAESFDRAWAIESMFHMPDKGQVLAEVARVLRPGGIVAIADIVSRAPAEGPLPKGHASLVALAGYGDVLRRAGLDPVEVTDVTEQTARTAASYAQWARSHRDRYVDVLGADGFEQLLGGRDDSLMPQTGYALITGRRPDRAGGRP